MTKRNNTTKPAANVETPVETAPVTNNVTVAMFARAHNVNPKTIRAKLRRIARKADAAIKHEHKKQWLFTREIAQAFNVDYDATVAKLTAKAA